MTQPTGPDGHHEYCFHRQPTASNSGNSQPDPPQYAQWSSSPFDPHKDSAFDRLRTLVDVCASTPPTCINASILNDPFSPSPSPYMVRAPPSDVEDEPATNSLPVSTTTTRNRRRHACKMCDKAFDRPSTLKTHLLVHTGITPFSCHLCGRRFGVQSNCNRHVKRCAVRQELFLTRRLEFEAAQSGKPIPSSNHSRILSRSPSPPVVIKPKRPRRKRSPEAAWIPQSLASFTLTVACPPAPIPLPPVRPRMEIEERDSYTICHDQPYTEKGWNGRLPGPAPPDPAVRNSRRNSFRR